MKIKTSFLLFTLLSSGILAFALSFYSSPAFAEVDAAAKLRCNDLAFWADNPNNTPGVYYLLKGITTIKPTEKTVAAINVKNNATGKTATNVKVTFTFSGTAKIKFVDSKSYCSWDPTNKKLNCSLPNILPSTSRSIAGRVKMLNNNIPGNILYVDGKVTSAQFPAHSCTQVSLQVI